MLIFDVLGEFRVPVYAMEESRNVRKELAFEDALVLAGIGIEIISIELGFWISWLYAILCVYAHQVYCFPMLYVILVLHYLIHIRRFDFSDRQILKDFNAPLRCPSPPCHCKNHWRQFLRDFFFSDIIAYLFEMIIALLDV